MKKEKKYVFFDRQFNNFSRNFFIFFLIYFKKIAFCLFFLLLSLLHLLLYLILIKIYFFYFCDFSIRVFLEFVTHLDEWISSFFSKSPSIVSYYILIWNSFKLHILVYWCWKLIFFYLLLISFLSFFSLLEKRYSSDIFVLKIFRYMNIPVMKTSSYHFEKWSINNYSSYISLSLLYNHFSHNLETN